MTPIKNKADFRRGYEFLGLMIECSAICGKPELTREKIIEAKRELRAYANKDSAVDVGMGFMCERRIVKDDGMDGYVELVRIPEVFDTYESANEFFRDFLEITASPSPFDCTGQTFTSWYKLFKRRGQFWAYHSIGFDV